MDEPEATVFGQMGLTGWAEGYLTDSDGNRIEPAVMATTEGETK